MTTMNERAWKLADEMESRSAELRVKVLHVGGCRVIDCGVAAVGGGVETGAGPTVGGLAAGLLLARVTMSDLGMVTLSPGECGPVVQVSTDDPVRACLGSQYAGWQVQVDRYFAMGSGPFRAAAAREPIYQQIHAKETTSRAVGVLETRKLPTEDVIANLVAKLPTEVEKLTLLVAPAASIAGTIQVVARSVETAIHKLHELKFDLTQLVSGFGSAPLPPVAKDELAAIGRTNDAILYGGRVTLWVNSDDAVIDAIGPQVPSSGSKDHGELFAELYSRYGDFYKIDPLLFSPAEVTFVNLCSGRARTFGRVEPGLIRKSFFERTNG